MTDDTNNVIPLNGTPIDTPTKPEVDEFLVESLEHYLNLAREGKLVCGAMCGVRIEDSGEAAVMYRFAADRRPNDLIAAVRVLSFQMMMAQDESSIVLNDD